MGIWQLKYILILQKKPYESEDFPFTYVIFCYYFLLFKVENSLDRKHMVSFTT